MYNFIYEYTPFLEHKVPELIHLITLIAMGVGGQGGGWGEEEWVGGGGTTARGVSVCE